MATRGGMVIRFAEEDARAMGRTARGVKAIELAEGDEVVGMARVKEGATLFTVTEQGAGRRTDFDNYRLQTRGGKGVRNFKVSDEKGQVAAVRAVTDEDDIIMITDDGIIIRFHSADVAEQSRYGSGVRVMRVPEGGRIVTLARVPHEEPEDEEEAQSAEAVAETAEGETTPSAEEKLAKAVQEFADMAIELQSEEEK